MELKIVRSFQVLAFLAAHITSAWAAESMLSLAGTWSFRLDPEDVGVTEKWFTLGFDDTIQLPGTTDENHKGLKKDEQCIDRLSRVWYWKGPAWYQRRVTIPDTWKGKRITLLLERSKNTRVWVDQIFSTARHVINGRCGNDPPIRQGGRGVSLRTAPCA